MARFRRDVYFLGLLQSLNRSAHIAELRDQSFAKHPAQVVFLKMNLYGESWARLANNIIDVLSRAATLGRGQTEIAELKASVESVKARQ